jgi:prepilin peptidase dependent protein B
MVRMNGQRGFTLVELMLAMALGVIVIGSVTGIYVGTVVSSRDTLASSKLNQELATLMTVMSNDIRRAGYWGGAVTGGTFNPPSDNPFSQATGTFTALVVKDAANNTLAANDATGGPCILYSYDAPGGTSGVLDDADILGFRLNNGVVQMRVSGDTTANARHDSCNDADDSWQALTDAQTIEVTTLNFVLENSRCLNLDDDANPNCYAIVPTAGSGNTTVETRQVRISLAGRLAGDNSVRAHLTQDVRVRNDLVRVH